MLAFAGNSILCRMALRNTGMDPVSFTSIRLMSGAVMLWLIVKGRSTETVGRGNWISALALYGYAAAFSYAYVSLPTGTGALMLFGAVQATMIGYSLHQGERLHFPQITGLCMALAGLVVLVLPGVSAPAPGGTLLMVGAGIAWGVYSIRGKIQGDATRVSAGNFLKATPIALLVSLVFWQSRVVPMSGLTYALLSGALTSGVGYVLWYAALPHLKGSTAATVQLSVPLLAAMAGVMWLGEPLTLRLAVAGVAILGGILLVILGRGKA